MPQWAGSCWYYLRYRAALATQSAWWTPPPSSYWLPVDLYVGAYSTPVMYVQSEKECRQGLPEKFQQWQLLHLYHS